MRIGFCGMPKKGWLDVLINRCVDLWQQQGIAKKTLKSDDLMAHFLTIEETKLRKKS